MFGIPLFSLFWKSSSFLSCSRGSSCSLKLDSLNFDYLKLDSLKLDSLKLDSLRLDSLKLDSYAVEIRNIFEAVEVSKKQ